MNQPTLVQLVHGRSMPATIWIAVAGVIPSLLMTALSIMFVYFSAKSDVTYRPIGTSVYVLLISLYSLILSGLLTVVFRFRYMYVTAALEMICAIGLLASTGVSGYWYILEGTCYAVGKVTGSKNSGYCNSWKIMVVVPLALALFWGIQSAFHVLKTHKYRTVAHIQGLNRNVVLVTDGAENV